MSAVNVEVKYLADFEGFKLSHRLHKDIDDTKRGYTGIHVGYESGEWNYREFIVWLQRHIPEFSLTPKELANFNDPTEFFAIATKAARLLHDREKKLDKKGEIGELILHGLIKDIYKTSPLVSKVYYKSHPSDNVKGFDCVHVIFDNSNQEITSLWLGEAKFYTDPKKAIDKAFLSVTGFLEARKMQKEFLTIRNHFDDSHEATKQAEILMSEFASLDEIKAKLCIPVLIAYESPATKIHDKISDEFLEELDKEIQEHIYTFLGKFKLEVDIDIHVFFFPLRDKKKALEVYGQHVDGYQGARSIY